MNNSTSSRPARHFGGGGKPSYRGGGGSRPSYNNNKKRGGRQGAYIDPQRYINKATTVAEDIVYVPTHAFTDFALGEALQQNIVKRGYTAPSPIQDQAIPAILEGRDVIGLANTGTGKTAAFVLPIIERLQGLNGRPAVLIVAPTRELALQIDDQFRAFAQGMRLYSTLCVGGMNIGKQIGELRRGPQVVIGTPGRLKDLINRNILSLSDVKMLVLDEADQMLDMGFVQDIRFLIAKLPQSRQSLCFSATITPGIQSLLDDLLKDPVTVSVRTRETSEHVDQDVVRVQDKDQKLEVLQDMLGRPEFEKVLIFGETKWGVQRLAENLTRQGIRAEAIHGNKSQPQRQRALQAFKRNDVSVLVATDVAARGLDIPNVSHVINFDQPQSYQDYIHRIGRTGRGGKKGQALTFVHR